MVQNPRTGRWGLRRTSSAGLLLRESPPRSPLDRSKKAFQAASRRSVPGSQAVRLAPKHLITRHCLCAPLQPCIFSNATLAPYIKVAATVANLPPSSLLPAVRTQIARLCVRTGLCLLMDVAVALAPTTSTPDYRSWTRSHYHPGRFAIRRHAILSPAIHTADPFPGPLSRTYLQPAIYLQVVVDICSTYLLLHCFQDIASLKGAIQPTRLPPPTVPYPTSKLQLASHSL
ncbi:predicted protein [Plenodomus lingam JN3]|uniref:Predicted protein n=1 Tax=Leptosphaeria maculans (strain JN3 / isolate v23.1.3 / race Av1-4-5-6-7-8) TaxID=985895 RepID=E5ABS9_LEPMJ|nr:predicted protein [Plenodomus lingam JN3]CBY01120.1 predicted protein [Plenodomus lingam JN3]